MCGIFGIYGAPRRADHDNFLKDAMFVGTLRGAHGSGVIHVAHNKDGSTFANTGKAAMTGPEFVQDTNLSKLLVTKQNTLAVIGHNRYSTIGGAVDANAHPFVRGAVSLVHNGVIDNVHELLKLHGKTQTDLGLVVDSDAAAYHLSETEPEDVVDALEDIEGAYALVWHDARNNSLNFARNPSRPMWFAKSGDVVGFASEKGMLEWLMTRNNLPITTSVQLAVGSLASFKYTDGKFIQSEAAFKHKERARVASRAIYSDDYDHSWYRGGANHSNRSRAASGGGHNEPTNMDGKSYAEITKDIVGRLARDGIVIGTAHDWYFSEYADFNDKAVLTLMSSELPSVSAVKYLYRGGNVTDKEYKLLRDTEGVLCTALESHRDNISIITAKPQQVLLSCTDNSWQAMTCDEIWKEKKFKVMFDSRSVVLHGLDAAGSYTVLFNFEEEYQKIKAASLKGSVSAKDGLVIGGLYNVIGVPPHYRTSLYKGSTYVTLVRTAESDPNSVIVQPINNKSATIMVPVSSLRSAV